MTAELSNWVFDLAEVLTWLKTEVEMCNAVRLCLWQVGGCDIVSLSCEETVKLIRSYGSLLSLTVVTVQKPTISESSAQSNIRTCKLNCIAVIFILCYFQHFFQGSAIV